MFVCVHENIAALQLIWIQQSVWLPRVPPPQQLPELVIFSSDEEPAPEVQQPLVALIVQQLPAAYVLLEPLPDQPPPQQLEPQPELKVVVVEEGPGEVDWSILEERLNDLIARENHVNLSPEWTRIVNTVALLGREEQPCCLQQQILDLLPNKHPPN